MARVVRGERGAPPRPYATCAATSAAKARREGFRIDLARPKRRIIARGRSRPPRNAGSRLPGDAGSRPPRDTGGDGELAGARDGRAPRRGAEAVALDLAQDLAVHGAGGGDRPAARAQLGDAREPLVVERVRARDLLPQERRAPPRERGPCRATASCAT